MRITIIGHFGGNKNFADGQTVKTKTLYKELKKSTNWEIKILDTYYKDKKPFRLLFKFICFMFSTKHIIILLSGNGMRFFFPILWFYVKFLKGNVYHDVVGGNLSTYVTKYPRYRKYLNSFNVNWVETSLLKKELEDVGIDNVQIIANFRQNIMISETELKEKYEKPFKLCTFSRVARDKGINEAIEAVSEINKKFGEKLCLLDIYGSIDDEYKNAFEVAVSKSDYVTYKGVVASEVAVEILREYYATLFPTHWDGESNAGTITESQFAGVPVIATDWRCNSEMITSGIDGVVYPGKEAETLEGAIMWLIQQKDRIIEIKRNSLKRAEDYLPEKSIPLIINEILFSEISK